VEIPARYRAAGPPEKMETPQGPLLKSTPPLGADVHKLQNTKMKYQKCEQTLSSTNSNNFKIRSTTKTTSLFTARVWEFFEDITFNLDSK
jgi:hypothetical protein